MAAAEPQHPPQQQQLAWLDGESALPVRLPCTRVFPKCAQFSQQVAAQAGELLITNFRVRFLPKPCTCASWEELGPPKWHASRACEMKGPVSPWTGAVFPNWPPPSAVWRRSHQAWEDVPLFSIRLLVIASSRSLVVHTRDVRMLEFEFNNDSENEGLMRLLKAYAFPQDPVAEAFAFQTRYRVGLGWDIFDPVVDAMRTLERRSRVPLRQCPAPCDTYPVASPVWVAKDVTEEDVLGSAQFRSLGRIPVAVWAHATNGSLLVRSAQPLVGLLGNRNAGDERLVRALCGPKYLLLDARSRAAALGNRALGKGTESVDRGYEGADLNFCDLGNIHAIRTSFQNVVRAIADTSGAATVEECSFAGDMAAWYVNVAQVLRASVRAATTLDQLGKSVFTHCSDGWDRTSQMCALIQLLLEPEYRTRRGFACVVEKNFVQFGFKFRDRTRGTPPAVSPSGSPSPPDPTQQMAKNEEEEVSPVFFLFIECVFQLLVQFPTRFEFTERFLVAVVDASFSGRFGTFLCDSEKERTERGVTLGTRSVWDFVCGSSSASSSASSSLSSSLSLTTSNALAGMGADGNGNTINSSASSPLNGSSSLVPFLNEAYEAYEGPLYPSYSPKSMRVFAAFWHRYDGSTSSSSSSSLDASSLSPVCFF